MTIKLGGIFVLLGLPFFAHTTPNARVPHVRDGLIVANVGFR